MIGLSTTAIGMRPIEECIQIFRTLQPHLSLDFLELAIGTNCDLSLIPPGIPLLLHDRCLSDKRGRIPFSLLATETWAPYGACAKDRNVLAMSVHPPLRRGIPWQIVLERRQALEEYLDVPVLLEVMPSEAYWCSHSCLPSDNFPLLLDISHINIWYRGSVDAVRRSFDMLLPRARGIHLSHNDGREDSHDLIPKDIWFEKEITAWGKGLLVTYESLPVHFAEHERLDKQKKKRSLR